MTVKVRLHLLALVVCWFVLSLSNAGLPNHRMLAKELSKLRGGLWQPASGSHDNMITEVPTNDVTLMNALNDSENENNGSNAERERPQVLALRFKNNLDNKYFLQGNTTNGSLIETETYSSDNLGRQHGLIYNGESVTSFDNRNSVSSDLLSKENILTNHWDRFKCPPCQCFYSNIHFIIANCTNNRLHDIPTILPIDLWGLSICDSLLFSFNMTSVLMYRSLTHLSLTANKKLLQIRNSTLSNGTSQITELDLSSNNIQSIDDNSFTSLPQLLSLTLSSNSLRNITNLTFEGLEQLRTLDLSINNISYVESGAFNSFSKLTTLDLSGNKFLNCYRYQFPEMFFASLQNLRRLFLYGTLSYGSGMYPSKALQHLSNLEELTIDGLPEGMALGPEVRTLKNFTRLNVGAKKGNCYIKVLTASFFEHLPYLESFSLSYCKLQNVTPDAFSNMTKLKHLTIQYATAYDLFTALEDIQTLQNSSLKSLSLVQLFHGALPCRFLGGEQSKYLRNIALEELDLSENLLSLLGDDFFQNLPRTLKRLILQRNRLALVDMFLRKIAFLNNLEVLDLTDQSFYVQSELPHESVTDGNYCKNVSGKISGNSMYTNDDEPSTRKMYELTGVNDDDAIFALTDDNIGKSNKKFGIPPNLKILKAPKFILFGMFVLTRRIINKYSLEEIDFSDSFLSKLGPISLMLPGIKRAILDGNYLTEIRKSFFPPNNSIAHLSMQRNNLGYSFADDENGKVLSDLKKAQYLDLSTNLIYRLPRLFFKGLENVRILKLSENQLQVLNTSFSAMPMLNYLNLSKNSISWISQEARDDLDSIAALHHIDIDLTNNPLPCTCAGLEIIFWMATTKAHFLNGDELVCRIENGEHEPLGELEPRVRSLQRYCASKGVIIASSVSSLVFFCLLLMFAMIYRHRWRLRYLQNITLARFMGYKPKDAISGYKYDAYLLYSEESEQFINQCKHELEIKRGHKLCLADRDFMPGVIKVSCVISALQNSTKTIPVVTPDFYEEDYSEYAVKMAMNEESYTKRSVLYAIVYRAMPVEEMSKCEDLLMIMKRNHYIEFPPEDETSEEVRQNFWNELSLAIGHNEELHDSNDETAPLV